MGKEGENKAKDIDYDPNNERLFIEFIIEGIVITDEKKYDEVRKCISSTISEILKENGITRLNISFSKITELEAMLLATSNEGAEYN